MRVKRSKTGQGFTHIDVMVAGVILVIAVVGTSLYQYHSSLNLQKADLHATGVRLALMLCEGWSGVDGATSFNPVNTFGSEFNISTSTGPSPPTGFTVLGKYKIIVGGTYYYVTLSWKTTTPNLKALNVIIKWDPLRKTTNLLTDAQKSYQLTVYVQNTT